MEKRILIADDEESIRYTFSSFLRDAGYLAETADSLSSCIKKMRAETFDLLFLDIRFGVDDGIEAIPELKGLQPDCAVVIITGNPDTKSINRARKQGASDYLVKPVRQASLLYIVQKTLSPEVAAKQKSPMVVSKLKESHSEYVERLPENK